VKIWVPHPCRAFVFAARVGGLDYEITRSRYYRSKGKFLLHAFVIMPDHLHALITPAPQVSLEKALQFIKGGFFFRLKSKLDVWMRSFNESLIMSEEKFVN